MESTAVAGSADLAPRITSSPPADTLAGVRGVRGIVLWICVSFYFSHWVGIGVASAAVFLIFLCALALRALGGYLKRDSVLLVGFMAVYATVVLILQPPTARDFAEWSSTATPRLLLLGLGPFIVFALISLLPPLDARSVRRFFLISYYISALTIGFEWILLNLLGLSSSLMPAFRESYSYYLRTGRFFRPFGLTGNAPVNGSILVIATWILIFSGAVTKPWRYLAATGVVLLLNNSGQALLAYAFLLAYYLYQKRRGVAKGFVLLSLAAGITYVLKSGLIPKLSLSYILSLFQFLGLQSIAAMDFPSLFLGGYGKFSRMYEDLAYVTEFYPVYAITRLGILLSLATWWYVYTRLPRRRRLALFLLLAFASIHYPTILYVELQVLIGVYIFWMPRERAGVTAHA